MQNGSYKVIRENWQKENLTLHFEIKGKIITSLFSFVKSQSLLNLRIVFLTCEFEYLKIYI